MTKVTKVAYQSFDGLSFTLPATCENYEKRKIETILRSITNVCKKSDTCGECQFSKNGECFFEEVGTYPLNWEFPNDDNDSNNEEDDF